MKILATLVTGSCLLLAVTATQAQPDTAKITRSALSFADSLVKTDSFQSWSAYADLAQPSVIKHYGGKEGFIEHIRTGRLRTVSAIAEPSAELQMLQLMNVQNDEWQCVIRESRYFHQNDQKYHYISNLIGPSVAAFQGAFGHCTPAPPGPCVPTPGFVNSANATGAYTNAYFGTPGALPIPSMPEMSQAWCMRPWSIASSKSPMKKQLNTHDV